MQWKDQNTEARLHMGFAQHEDNQSNLSIISLGKKSTEWDEKTDCRRIETILESHLEVGIEESKLNDHLVCQLHWCVHFERLQRGKWTAEDQHCKVEVLEDQRDNAGKDLEHLEQDEVKEKRVIRPWDIQSKEIELDQLDSEDIIDSREASLFRYEDQCGELPGEDTYSQGIESNQRGIATES